MKTQILAATFILATAVNASAERSFLQIGETYSNEFNSIETAANAAIDSPVQPIIVPDSRPVIRTYQTQSSTDAAGNTTTNTVITESPAPVADIPVTTTVTQGEYKRLIDAGGQYDASGDTYSPKIQAQ